MVLMVHKVSVVARHVPNEPDRAIVEGVEQFIRVNVEGLSVVCLQQEAIDVVQVFAGGRSPSHDLDGNPRLCGITHIERPGHHYLENHGHHWIDLNRSDPTTVLRVLRILVVHDFIISLGVT